MVAPLPALLRCVLLPAVVRAIVIDQTAKGPYWAGQQRPIPRLGWCWGVAGSLGFGQLLALVSQSHEGSSWKLQVLKGGRGGADEETCA